jgi:hypothetical protein
MRLIGRSTGCVALTANACAPRRYIALAASASRLVVLGNGGAGDGTTCRSLIYGSTPSTAASPSFDPPVALATVQSRLAPSPRPLGIECPQCVGQQPHGQARWLAAPGHDRSAAAPPASGGSPQLRNFDRFGVGSPVGRLDSVRRRPSVSEKLTVRGRGQGFDRLFATHCRRSVPRRVSGPGAAAEMDRADPEQQHA